MPQKKQDIQTQKLQSTRSKSKDIPKNINSDETGKKGSSVPSKLNQKLSVLKKNVKSKQKKSPELNKTPAKNENIKIKQANKSAKNILSPRKKTIRKVKCKKVNYRSEESESNSEHDIIENSVNNEILYPQGTFLAYVDPTSDDPTKFKICQLNQDVKTNDSEFDSNIFEQNKAGSLDFEQTHSKTHVFDNTIVCQVEAKIQQAQAQKGKQKAPQKIKISKQEFNKIQKIVPAIILKLDQEIEKESDDFQDSDFSEKESIYENATKKKKIQKKKNQIFTKQEPQKNVKLGKKTTHSQKPHFSAESDPDEVKSPAVQKRRKTDPKEKVFKLNSWNPNVQIEDVEQSKFGTSNKISTFCCRRCSNREVHRAIYIKDYNLLKECIKDKHSVSNLNAYWGPDTMDTPFSIAIRLGDKKALECLLKPTLTANQQKDQVAALAQIFNDRGSNEQYLMNFIDSGTISGNMAYGSYVRSVQMTRGNRQGNNSFLQYQETSTDPMQHFNQMIWSQNLPNFFLQRIITPEIFTVIEKLTAVSHNNIKQQVSQAISNLAKAGDYQLLRHIIKDLWQQPNYGFNELHYQVLCDYKSDQKLPEFKSVNVQKKCNQAYNVTPLHFACFNPNPKVLQQVLSVNGDINMTDSQMRKPVHFAAVCENELCLKILVEKGANLIDVDNQKFTPLHYAAKANRPKCVQYLLQQSPGLINMKTKQGLNAMAFACEGAYLECVKLFINGGIKINTCVGRDRMSALHYAASQGDYEMAEWLLEQKARVQTKDKFKRTPLIMACRNGHIKLASLLLQRGADWEQADSSGNTPLHYAAAYGWPEIIELLLKIGSQINVQNSWRTTPINIAMLKNHEGCVKKFLEYPEIDVNCKDEKGRTLLSLSLIHINERTLPFVQYLLQKKADPNITDVDGSTPLHILASLNIHQIAKQPYLYNYQPETLQKIDEAVKLLQNQQLELADCLLTYGASREAIDNNKKTPFQICLEQDNVELLEKLLKGLTLDSDPQILHCFTQKILQIRYQEILKKLLANSDQKESTMNVMQEKGLTPLLAYLDHFSETFEELRAKLIQLCNYKAKSLKANFSTYNLTNESLFDKFLVSEIQAKQNVQKSMFPSYQQNQDNTLSIVQDDVPHEKIVELANQLIQNLITDPFVKILQLLIQKGANPFSQVGKLKKFRDLENKLSIAQDQIVEVQNTEKVKKREEILKERMKLKNKKKIRASTRKGQNLEKELDLRPGEGLGDSEYDTLFGLRNAYHFAIISPQPLLLDYLDQLGVNPDSQDHRGITPLNLAVVKLTNRETDEKDQTIDRLIRLNVQIDLPDFKGRTPFLNLYSNYDSQDIIRAEKLLKLGANVNQQDSSGLFALKYALIRRDSNQIKKLVQEFQANINQNDSKGRNLLHHAINMSSATADASFEIEQLIISLGVEINRQDYLNRTPLHYSFVKIKNWQDKSQIDPIETVSSLCGIQGLLTDLPDKWLKTPLHYASSRGASICSLYLEKRGANIEAKDIYGNTPLGVGLASKHFNFCILMIQKKANVGQIVYKENPEYYEQLWKKQNKDVNMIEEKQKGHRQLFDNSIENVFYGSEEESENSEYQSDQNFEQNVFNNQNAFNIPVFGQQINQKKEIKLVPEKQNEEEPMSMFRIAIKNTQLGLAYLILDNGYSLMLAMQDALDEKKFQLVLTLLQKVSDDNILKQKNEKGQNLFHVLCQNAKHCHHDHMKRIYQQLKRRGVNCLELDNQDRSALHYAVIGGTHLLIDMLLEEGACAKQLDKQGLSPLIIYLQAKKCLNLRLYDSKTATFDLIFKKLIDAGSQIDLEYQEEIYKSKINESRMDSWADSQNYKCTILINVIRNLTHITDQKEFNQRVLPNVLGLLKVGASLNIADSDGRDCIMYAVMSNNNLLVQLLLQNFQNRPFALDRQDLNGKSTIHYVVQPMSFASYENVKLLDSLHQAGFSIDLTDKIGLTPLDYAKKQSTGKMAKKLIQIMNLQQNEYQQQNQVEGILADDWRPIFVDYQKDSELLIKEAQQKEDEEMQDFDKVKELVPVDETGNFEKSFSVYVELGLKNPQTDESLGPKPWDAYLTKVDLKNGLYGDYVFYKMQLLYDSVRDLYVVFTRWGRIGENGMNQRTPFPKLEEAKAEFCQIFKSKTGNDFSVADVSSNFERVQKKYNLSQITYSMVNHKDYMAPFDFKKCPPPQKLDQPTLDLLEEIANITMYQKAVKELGIDTKAMPIASLSKTQIEQASQILSEIKVVLDKDQEITSKGLLADHSELLKVKQQISDLSSRFYELIPLAKYHNQIAPPLTNAHELKQHFEALQSLSNIEKASKMLLGALYRQKEINPIEYLYEALNIQIQQVGKEQPEHQIIINYIKNTNEGSINFDTHKVNIFYLQRKGEPERIHQINLHNHRLLFHGSQMFNFIGILADGLKIAPPEAPSTGYMFGKGVYFADMLQKSYQYSQQRFSFSQGYGGISAQDSTLLLLCEVALGNEKKVWKPTEDSQCVKLKNSEHSVRGVGKHGPDYSQSLFMSNGIEIPQGPKIEYNDFEPEDLTKKKEQTIQQTFGFGMRFGGFPNNFGTNNQIGVYLSHNEFIVYDTDQICMRYLIQVVKKTKEEMKIQF